MCELTMTSASVTFCMFFHDIFSGKSHIYFENPLQEPGESCDASVTIHDTQAALNKIHIVWL